MVEACNNIAKNINPLYNDCNIIGAMVVLGWRVTEATGNRQQATGISRGGGRVMISGAAFASANKQVVRQPKTHKGFAETPRMAIAQCLFSRRSKL